MAASTTIRALVLETGPATTKVRLQASGCSGCKQDCNSAREISLPGAFRGAVDLTMAEGDKWRLALHSLLLPLAGFVGGALLAETAGLPESLSVVLSFLGLGLGVLLCRPHTFKTIHFTEAVEDE